MKTSIRTAMVMKRNAVVMKVISWLGFHDHKSNIVWALPYVFMNPTLVSPAPVSVADEE